MSLGDIERLLLAGLSVAEIWCAIACPGPWFEDRQV